MPTKQDFLDFSRFDANAILRGAQLTFVGAQRALQNPALWTTQHYRQAAVAVACGIAIRVLVEIPVVLTKVLLWAVSWFVALDAVTWDDTLTDGLRFLQEYVLQVPLFLMALLRHVTPAMDELFMASLAWVDYTYAQKHAHDEPAPDQTTDTANATDTTVARRYHDNLANYATYASQFAPTDAHAKQHAGLAGFLWRSGRKAGLSLAVFALSYVPVVGRLVLPATSFYTFRRSVGLGPACLIFGLGLFLPRRYLVVFLQTYYGARSLMRELLGPYFARTRLTAHQKKRWFASREGLLFGFGAGFYLLLRVPLVGVLVYGIAEASTAYLVTKVTDPPPSPADFAASESGGGPGAVVNTFNESQQTWTNRRAFLELALDNLDALQQKHQAAKADKARQAGRPRVGVTSAGDAGTTSGTTSGATSGTTLGAAVSQRGNTQQRFTDGPPPYSE